MARRSTEYDQFVMSGQKTAPQSTTTFGDFSAIIQNNERLANPPEVTPSFSAFSPVAPSPYNGSQPSYGNAPTPASGMAVFSDEAVTKAITGATDERVKTPATGTVGATGATDTGYSQFAPDYEKKEAQIEGEYARALPTYGALAEQMAQAGIHGGYSDYLQGVAYAKMQEAKANSYADYVAQQDTATKEKQAQNGAMYDLFGRSEYTDSEGNTAQGYGLLNIANDEDYTKARETARAEALYRGADESSVDEALKNVDAMRKLYKDQVSASATDALKNYNAGKLEPAQLFGALGYTPSEGESEGVALLSALDSAVDNGMISPEQRSETLKNGLSLYSGKPSAKDVLKSIKTAIDLNDEGAMTDEDKNAVLEDALKEVETYFKGKKRTVKIENGKLYAKNKAGAWEDLGNLKYKSEFETILRGSYYDDVVKLVYENRNKK